MGNLNTVDYILMALLVIGGIQGAFKGFLEELAQKFGFVFGFIVSLMFTKSCTSLIVNQIDVPLWVASGIAYVILFLIGYLLIKAISTVIDNLFNSNTATFINSLLGFILGVVETMIICGAIIQLLDHQSIINLTSYFNGSLLNSKIVSPFFKTLISITNEVF